MLRAPAAGALEADLVVVARLIDVIMAEDMTVADYAAGASGAACVDARVNGAGAVH